MPMNGEEDIRIKATKNGSPSEEDVTIPEDGKWWHYGEDTGLEDGWHEGSLGGEHLPEERFHRERVHEVESVMGKSQEKKIKK